MYSPYIPACIHANVHMYLRIYVYACIRICLLHRKLIDCCESRPRLYKSRSKLSNSDVINSFVISPQHIEFYIRLCSTMYSVFQYIRTVL